MLGPGSHCPHKASGASPRAYLGMFAMDRLRDSWHSLRRQKRSRSNSSGSFAHKALNYASMDGFGSSPCSPQIVKTIIRGEEEFFVLPQTQVSVTSKAASTNEGLCFAALPNCHFPCPGIKHLLVFAQSRAADSGVLLRITQMRSIQLSTPLNHCACRIQRRDTAAPTISGGSLIAAK